MTRTFTIDQLSTIHDDYGDGPGDFCLQVHCEVISTATKGGEAFAVTIISPSRMQADLEAGQDGYEMGRGYVFALEIDRVALQRRLQRFIDASHASCWEELERYVSRFFDWV